MTRIDDVAALIEKRLALCDEMCVEPNSDRMAEELLDEGHLLPDLPEPRFDRLAEAGKANPRHISLLAGYRSLIDTDDLPNTAADALPGDTFIARVDGQITTVQRFIDNAPADEYPWRDIYTDWHSDNEVELLALIDPRTDEEDAEDYRR